MAYETIEIKDLEDVTEKISKEYPHWLRVVARGISNEKEWKSYSVKKCSPENVRHIASGMIISQFHRRLYMKVIAKLLLDISQRKKDIEETLEQVNEA